jgi:3'-phosphoadenosine 5'-phosphosulfate sulfotransferase (PAPS reductase)/FAD synthetase
MEQRPLYIASCSFGKDSIATILLALEHNEPLDRAVFVEVMFDNKRNISGEIPEHIEWVYSTAIPKLESMGVKVDVVRSDNDYIGCFYRKIARSKHPDRVGKIQGFPYSLACKILRDCKMPAVRKYWSQFDNVVKYVGIAIDEEKRLDRLNGQISLLAKYGISEKGAWEMCERVGLLSPVYQIKKRNGCWFCPNVNAGYLAHLKQTAPHLYEELEHLSKVPNKVSDCFCYSRTFEDVEKEVQRIIEKQQQLTLF